MYLFITDYVQEIGGAEQTDAKLRHFLGGKQVILRSADCSIEKLKQYKDYNVIVSNFTALTEPCKEYISDNMNYIIYEHDHKYLKNRDPSFFKDWKAPFEYIVNLEFYRKAKSVVCQTKQHMDVVYRNTNLNNLVNYGGSIWSDNELNYLETLLDTVQKNNLYAVMNSQIVHKGTQKAVNYCRNTMVKYKLLELKDWKDFILDLSNCNHLVFFPGVLETCSRISVEARMLNITVIGNNNISALKEDWFISFKGKDLINYFRTKNTLIKKFIENCFTEREEKKETQADITVILNLYKRPQNLQKQIDAFLNQTVKPKEIWVFMNKNEKFEYPLEDIEYRRATNAEGIDKLICVNDNFGVFGRFAIAQLVKTKFICINDDDTIPGPKWLETCLDSFVNNPGLQGGIGVNLHSDNYTNHSRIGWANPRPITEEVDLVGHSWFFPKEYLKYMWMEEPFTWNMEDAHFSYCLKKYGKIKTFVPPQMTKDESSSILGYELGVDEAAMSNPKNHQKFYKERDEAIKYYLDNGWKK
jgi:hypothetical protein